MILPAILLILVFILIPILYGFYLSLVRWDGFNPPVFVGLANYIKLSSRDDIFRKAITNNIIFAVSVVLAKNVLGLFLALLLNQKLRGQTFFRTALYLPVTMSFVVIGLLWSWILNPTFGLLNAGLLALGLENWTQAWLGDERFALWVIIAVDIWKWAPFHMVLFLAGLQTIPSDLYEAAIVDGATAWKRFSYITLPLLAPITFINVFLALNGAFVLNFDVVYIMTGGGPNHATEVALTHMISEGFQYGNFGYASALGFVLFGITMIIGFIYFRAARGGTYNF